MRRFKILLPRRPIPALLLGVALGLLASCTPSGASERSAAPFPGKADGPVAEVSRFHEDGQFALRQIVDLTDTESVSFSAQPFSHRSKRWHVFPFSAYGEARYPIRVEVDDPAMKSRAGLWIYGPRRDDGSWGAPVEASSDGNGVLTAEVTTRRYGQYAAVVGPRDEEGFLPRYPGDRVHFDFQPAEPDGTSGVAEARLERAGDGKAYLVEADVQGTLAVYEIEDPFTDEDERTNAWGLWAQRIENPDSTTLGEADQWMELLGRPGERVWIDGRTWSRSMWLAPEDAASDDDLVLGDLNDLGQENTLEVWNGSEYEDYLVIEALDAKGNAISLDERGHGEQVDPVVIRAIRPFDAEGDELTVVECPDDDPARQAYAEVDLPCTRIEYVDSEDPVTNVEVHAFRSTFVDFDERSTYGISFGCEGECAPSAPPAQTHYPIYFAHGFNSSREAWTDLIDHLAAQPGWEDAVFFDDPADEDEDGWKEPHGWIYAESVPGYDPVPVRAEQLRRNLEEFLSRLERDSRQLETEGRDGLHPPHSERFMRINVVAHSMGGLDTRYLMGHEKYNNDRCHELLECTDASGDLEPCCAADPDGGAIEWRERVVSLTTLSTPHCGSSFASWGIRQLRSLVLDWAFRKAAELIFGLDTASEQEALRETLHALSKEYCVEIMEEYGAPNPDRVYDWSAATDPSRRTAIGVPESDLPAREGAAGERASARYRLPAPARLPTLFGWASHSCLTGTCGDALDTGLRLPYMVVKKNEGDNDGVVASESANFGIFMGVRSNDHFRWTRLESGGVSRFLTWAFGSKREPMSDWHLYWLDELKRAGY